jgi:hypothetical protein
VIEEAEWRSASSRSMSRSARPAARPRAIASIALNAIAASPEATMMITEFTP